MSGVSLRDIDIYRTAKVLIDRYGDDAPAVADAKIRYWLDRNDRAGRDIWRSVHRAIEVLKLFGPASLPLLQ
jgi:hypothetical protein